VKLIAELLIDQFNGVVIMADTYYEIANKMIEKIMPNLPIKFYTFITKPKRKKHKKVKNINVNPSNRIAMLIQE
jgi:hypothetical protein